MKVAVVTSSLALSKCNKTKPDHILRSPNVSRLFDHFCAVKIAVFSWAAKLIAKSLL